MWTSSKIVDFERKVIALELGVREAASQVDEQAASVEDRQLNRSNLGTLHCNLLSLKRGIDELVEGLENHFGFSANRGGTLPERIRNDIVEAHPALRYGRVWCGVCDRVSVIPAVQALAVGWPVCCGSTMHMDGPRKPQDIDERAWRHLKPWQRQFVVEALAIGLEVPLKWDPELEKGCVELIPAAWGPSGFVGKFSMPVRQTPQDGEGYRDPEDDSPYRYSPEAP